MKKILITIFAVLLGFFLLSASTAVADTKEPGFYLDDVKYDTFEEAYAQVNSYYKRTYITRYGDYTQSSNLSIGKFFTLDVVEGTFTFAENITVTATSLFTVTSTGSGKFVWNGTFTFSTSNNPMTVSGGTHENFTNIVNASKQYYSLKGGTFLNVTSADKTNMAKKCATGYTVNAQATGATYTVNVITLAESVANTSQTKSSLKATYTKRSYWKRVTDNSQLKDGDQVLLAYVWASTDSLVLMKNYGSDSYKMMYCESNKSMTRQGNTYKSTLKSVNILSNTSFEIGDSLKNFLFTYTVKSTTKYLSSNFDNKVLYTYDDRHLHTMSLETLEYNQASDSNYQYGFTLDQFTTVASMGGKNITFGIKVASNGSQGMVFLSSDSLYVDNGQNTTNVVMHAYVYVDEYVVSSASLRFGGVLNYTDKVKIDKLGTVTYGIVAASVNRVVGDLTIDNATYQQEITPICVANIGDAEEDAVNGNYYQYSLVIQNIPKEYYSNEFIARAYICVNGTYYYYQPARYSLKTLSNVYVNAADTSSYTDHLGLLNYLAS